MKETINLENGKYTISHEDGLNFNCRRHGNEWRDLTGDSLVLSMFLYIQNLEEKVEDIEYHNDRIEEALESQGIDLHDILYPNKE